MLTYTVVGHVCVDELYEQPSRLGGTVFFSAGQALTMGCAVTVVTTCTDATSERARRELAPEIALDVIPAGVDTRFGFGPDAEQGPLRLVSAAPAVGGLPASASTELLDVLHLAPVFNEITPGLVESARDLARFVGATPQGLLRGTDADGALTFVASNWPAVDDFADAIVLNDEEYLDLSGLGLLDRFGGWVFRTLGPRGASLFRDGVEHGRSIPPPPEGGVGVAEAVREHAIGAGDVFAAAAFVAMARGDDPEHALDVAVRSATSYVRRPGDAPAFTDGSHP